MKTKGQIPLSGAERWRMCELRLGSSETLIMDSILNYSKTGEQRFPGRCRVTSREYSTLNNPLCADDVTLDFSSWCRSAVLWSENSQMVSLPGGQAGTSPPAPAEQILPVGRLDFVWQAEHHTCRWRPQIAQVLRPRSGPHQTRS